MSRFDVVDQFRVEARNSKCAEDVGRLMEAITAEMGFSAYALYQHVQHWEWKAETLAISSYPRGWVERFFSHEFNNFDPVLRAAERTAFGFRWSEIGSIVRLSPKQIRVLEEGRNEGLADGFTVPAHIPGESSGSCSFAVGANKALPERNFGMAQLVGGFGYEAARRLWLKKAGIVRSEKPNKLTPRQHDCLVLLAQGKTDWEMAKILGLKPSTVNGYIDEAKKVLGATRRSQLVTRALFEGHLSLSDTLQ